MSRVSKENLIIFRDEFSEIFAPAWQVSHYYLLGDVITHTGRRKKCKVPHTSTSTFDASKWENEDVETALSKKANKDGSYKTLTSGNAYNLIDEHATGVNREFIFDTAAGTASIAGDGTASVESIEGNTLVWNQLFTSFNAETKSGITLTIENGRYKFSGRATNTVSFHESNKYPVIAGHYYYATAHSKVTPSNNTKQMVLSVSEGAVFNIRYSLDRGNLIKCTTSGKAFVNFTIYADYEIDETLTFSLFDLTQMFGAGNEPSTVAEFEAMFPLNYYAYNAGELLSFNGTGIKTIGFNAFNLETGKAKLLANNQYQITGTYPSATSDAETITIGADGKFTPTKNGTLTVVGGDNTTCVHLVWSGYRNGEYEAYWEQTKNLPNLSHFDVEYTGADGETHVLGGMKSAGTAHDEVIKLSNGKYKAIRRMGVVDLGNLSYANITSYENMYYADISNAPKRAFEIKTVKYNIASKSYQNIEDKEITSYGSTTYNTSRIAIKDTLYSTKEELKASLAGVLLIYELATPVESEEFEWNGNYQVADFGTEALLPENDDEPTTTPIKAVVKYSTDFPREIANLPKSYLTLAAHNRLINAINQAFEILHNGGLPTIDVSELGNDPQPYYEVVEELPEEEPEP